MRINRIWLSSFVQSLVLSCASLSPGMLQCANAEMSVANGAPPIFSAPPASANAPTGDSKPTGSRPFLKFETEEKQKAVFPVFALNNDEANRLTELDRSRKKNELSLILKIERDLPGMIKEEQEKGLVAFTKQQNAILNQERADPLIPKSKSASEEHSTGFESSEAPLWDAMQTKSQRHSFQKLRLGVLEKLQENNRIAEKMTFSETLAKAAQDTTFATAVGIDVVVGGVVRPFFNAAAKIADDMIRNVHCVSLGLDANTACSTNKDFQDYWGSLMTGEDKEYTPGAIAMDVIGLAASPALAGLADNIVTAALKQVPNELSKLSIAVGEGIERIRLGYPALGFLDEAGNLLVKNSRLIRQHFKNESGLASELIEIYKTPKGQRPSADAYLSKEFIEKHLKEFDNGASRFMRKSEYEKYGPAQIDGTSFVIPSDQAYTFEKMIAKDPTQVENILGMPPGHLRGDGLVRVDFDNPRKLNLRIPSGNEAGANGLWMPGGKTSGGGSEAVIDLGGVPSNRWKVRTVGN